MNKSGSFDYELPLKYLSLKISSFSDIYTTKLPNELVKFVHYFMLLTFVFCVLKRKGMTTKKPEEATYG